MWRTRAFLGVTVILGHLGRENIIGVRGFHFSFVASKIRRRVPPQWRTREIQVNNPLILYTKGVESDNTGEILWRVNRTDLVDGGDKLITPDRRLNQEPKRPSSSGEQKHAKQLSNVPRHVGIILDGNGRWAQRRGLPLFVGHARGAQRVIDLVPILQNAGIQRCTMYCFSTENWSRPYEEVQDIMNILQRTCFDMMTDERIVQNKVRVRFIGERLGLPPNLLDAMDKLETRTKTTARNNTHQLDGSITLCLAVNYGGRRDLVQAAKRLAQDIANGSIDHEQVTEATFGQYLCTSDDDPQLIIRTGGEHRLSNFMLWNAAYSELYFTDILWPDFDGKCLDDALEWYAQRDRRFGGRPAHSQDRAQHYS